MSASSSPTVAPLLRSAAATLTATVDLPTPPLPDAMAMVCFTPGSTSEGFGRRKAGRTLAVMRTSTPVTPGISWTASSACDLHRSRTGHAGVVSSKVKLTLPCGVTSSSLIMPRLTTSRPRSGSLIPERAWRTCCDDTLIGCDLTGRLNGTPGIGGVQLRREGRLGDVAPMGGGGGLAVCRLWAAVRVHSGSRLQHSRDQRFRQPDFAGGHLGIRQLASRAPRFRLPGHMR